MKTKKPITIKILSLFANIHVCQDADHHFLSPCYLSDDKKMQDNDYEKISESFNKWVQETTIYICTFMKKFMKSSEKNESEFILTPKSALNIMYSECSYHLCPQKLTEISSTAKLEDRAMCLFLLVLWSFVSAGCRDSIVTLFLRFVAKSDVVKSGNRNSIQGGNETDGDAMWSWVCCFTKCVAATTNIRHQVNIMEAGHTPSLVPALQLFYIENSIVTTQYPWRVLGVDPISLEPLSTIPPNTLKSILPDQYLVNFLDQCENNVFLITTLFLCHCLDYQKELEKKLTSTGFNMKSALETSFSNWKDRQRYKKGSFGICNFIANLSNRSEKALVTPPPTGETTTSLICKETGIGSATVTKEGTTSYPDTNQNTTPKSSSKVKTSKTKPKKSSTAHADDGMAVKHRTHFQEVLKQPPSRKKHAINSFFTESINTLPYSVKVNPAKKRDHSMITKDSAQREGHSTSDKALSGQKHRGAKKQIISEQAQNNAPDADLRRSPRRKGHVEKDSQLVEIESVL